ncbi:MAG: CRTAC1 family protein [Verrucomicrobiales bacterium]
MTAVPAGPGGLDYVLKADPAHPLNRLYYSGYLAGGIAAGDVNGDALPDLVMASGAGPNRLYLNSGDFTFQPAPTDGGLSGGNEWGCGVTMADADGDGDLDVYVCNYESPNQLWLNDGKGAFTAAPADSGAALKDGSLMAAFADYDRDGDLDLYLLTNRIYRDGGRPQSPPYRMGPGNVPEVLPEFAPYFRMEQQGPTAWTANEYGRRDYLLRNDSAPGGPLRYTDVTEESGVSDIGHGLSVTWWDFDGDGWLDLYVANDFDDPDYLYKNLGPVGGKVRFQDVTRAALPHTAWFCMGADAGDLTNDGLPDFFVVDMAATTHFKDKLTMGDMSAKYELMEFGEPRQIMRNTLYVNTGSWRFAEAAYLAGVAKSDWSWTAKMLDFDLDGRLDLYVTNGMIRNFRDSDRAQPPSALVGKTEWDLYKDLEPLPEVNLAWRNAGELKFEDVAKPWGLADEGISYGAAHADFDGDGDPDLAVLNLDRPVSLYRNDFTGHRVVFRLDTPRRTQGIGATLTLRAGGLLQTRTLSPATGFTSCNEPLVFFGLGTADKIDELTVHWPSGHTETFRDLAANRRYTLTQPVTRVEPPGVAPWTGPDAEAVMEDNTLTFPAPASQGNRHDLLRDCGLSRIDGTGVALR